MRRDESVAVRGRGRESGEERFICSHVGWSSVERWRGRIGSMTTVLRGERAESEQEGREARRHSAREGAEFRAEEH